MQFILIHGPNIPGSYEILFLIALDFTFIMRHIHSWETFPLWPSLFILSEAIFPLFPSSILDIFLPGRLIFWCHNFLPLYCSYFLIAQMVKRLPTMQETWVQSLGWEDTLEKEMATHSSILAWKIPWMEEPGWLLSMGSQRVGHDWLSNFTTYLLRFLRQELSGLPFLVQWTTFCQNSSPWPTDLGSPAWHGS